MNLHNDPAKLLALCYHGSPVEVACTWCADEINQVEHLMRGEAPEAVAYALAVIAHYQLPEPDIKQMKGRVLAATEVLLLAEALTGVRVYER